MFRKSNKGFSLLELMLVLGIAGCIMISSFIIYPKVQKSQQQQNEDYSSYISQDIINIQNKIQEVMKDKPSYTDLKFMSSKDFTENTEYVKIEPSRDGPAGTEGSAFNIIYNRLSKDECQKVLNRVSSNFYTINVNNIKLSNKDLCTLEENSLTFTSL